MVLLKSALLPQSRLADHSATEGASGPSALSPVTWVFTKTVSTSAYYEVFPCLISNDEADNQAYLLFASDNNQNFKIARMDSNYYTLSGLVSTQNGVTFEAPGIVKRNGVYHLFTSHTSGWAPNPNKVVTVCCPSPECSGNMTYSLYSRRTSVNHDNDVYDN
jgi:hypothetical protein